MGAHAKVGDRIRPHDMSDKSSLVVTAVSDGCASCGGFAFKHGAYEVVTAAPAPSLSREELAARFAVGAYAHAHEYPSGSREAIADAAVKMADALLAALSSKPALAPPPDAEPPPIFPTCPTCGKAMGRIQLAMNIEAWRCDSDGRLHPFDLPPAAAPVAAPVEAKRPEYVRVVGRVSLNEGLPRRVLGWKADGRPIVGSCEVGSIHADESMPFPVDFGCWEPCASPLDAPCAPPSPEAPDARGEDAIRALPAATKGV